MTKRYIGIMSGSSCDGIDAVIAECDQHIRVLHALHKDYPPHLRQQLLHMLEPQHNELVIMAELDVQLGKLYAETVLELLQQAQVKASAITAVGCHGQTIRHEPNAPHPYSIQIGNGHVIAANTHITTVNDFRRRDIALGGQGAPLAPLFHAAMFVKDHPVWVCNIGGIANLSYIDPQQGALCGFDTGPGNALLDAWYHQHHTRYFDNHGAWGQTGQCHADLLHAMLQDPYFLQSPPKSTGRDYFHLDWLKNYRNQYPGVSSQDIQATLTHLTATSIIEAITASPHQATELWLCGGGTKNTFLMQALKHIAPSRMHIHSSEEHGLDPQHIEAAGFAWLAHCCIHGQPGNSPLSTGARENTVLGCIHPRNHIKNNENNQRVIPENTHAHLN